MHIENVLGLLNSKMTMLIICNLSKGKMRFKEIEGIIEGISTRVLLEKSKNLEVMDILIREIFKVVPNEVEHTL